MAVILIFLICVFIMMEIVDRAPDGEDLGDMGVYIGSQEDKEIK